MDVLIILIFVIIAHVYVYQIITLYSLKVYNYICQLFLNECLGKRRLMYLLCLVLGLSLSLIYLLQVYINSCFNFYTLYLFARDAITKCHILAGMNSRSLFSPSSKSKIKCYQGQLPLRPLSLASRLPPSPCLLILLSLYSGSPHYLLSSYKGTSLIGLEPCSNGLILT